MNETTTCQTAPKRDFDSPAPRMRQLERVLLIVEILSTERVGMTLAEITEEVNDRLGVDYCQRTIRRDMIALRQMGIAESVTERKRQPQWRWVDRWFRSAVCERVASQRRERAEAVPSTFPRSPK